MGEKLCEKSAGNGGKLAVLRIVGLEKVNCRISFVWEGVRGLVWVGRGTFGHKKGVQEMNS